jgi:tetratricopeptide (TPR) repeat protein
LLPGTLLGISLLVGAGGERARRAVVAFRVAALVCAGLSVWALSLADSRGATVALVAGLGAMVFFLLPGRWRWLPAVLGVVLVAVALWWVTAAMNEPSATGRSTTLRFRTYTWGYAWQMFREQPVTGHGQGGFAMLGDSYVGEDVFRDPPVFGSRIDSAHNEWLEVLAELGAVGFLLAAGVIYLTLRAAMPSRAGDTFRADRSTIVGLAGSFVALCVEECVGNGLRVCELPLAFYTVLGLLWASCRSAADAPWASRVITPKTKPILAGAGIVLAVALLVVNQQDFRAARNAYDTDELLAKGEDESAIGLASLAVDRLSPQRVLINLFRLASTQTIAAERLAARAADRDRRGRESDPPNPRLSAMVAEDLGAMEELCKAASHTLKSLVSASPGFINHGQLEYRINSLLARAAAWRKESDAATAYMKNAAAALERELSRQPFDPATAAEFVRIGAAQLDAGSALATLARPLRYNRITESYVAVLMELGKRDDVQRAVEAFSSGGPQADPGGNPWRSEKLRLAATMAFARGDYATAVAALEQAVADYASVLPEEAIGVAAAYAELADGRFYSDPQHPDAALAAAADAITKAPDSRPGRELRGAVRQRTVHYLLAKDDEVAAKAILREVAPAAVDEPIVDQELGTRYRRLCESLLQRREIQTLRKPVEALLPNLVRWSRRAIELASKDPATHVLAADLAFFQEDDDATARHLGDALRAGLNPADAARFLDVALKKRPAKTSLIELRASLPAKADESGP